MLPLIRNTSCAVPLGIVMFCATTLSGHAVGGPDCVSPVLIDDHQTPGEAVDSIRESGFLYIALREGIIQVYDVSDPSNRFQIEQYTIADSVLTMHGEGELLYVGTDNGMYFIDRSNPADLVERARYGNSDWEGFAVRNGIVYCPAGFGGVSVVDMRDPDAVEFVTNVDISPSTADNIIIQENMLFAMNGLDMNILDISTLTDPEYLGRWRHERVGSRRVEDIQLLGDFALCGIRGGFGLVAVDISDPTQPRTHTTGVLNTGSVFSFAVVGDVAFVSSRFGWSMIDVSDLTSFALIEDFPDPTPNSGFDSVLVVDIHADQETMHIVWERSASGDPNTNRYIQAFDITNQCLTCPGDFLSDGVLDFFDVSIFIGYLAQNNIAADMNGDGIVNFFDASAFLSLYASGCP